MENTEIQPIQPPPWKHPNWLTETEPVVTAAVRDAGHTVTGPLCTVKSWGRSHLATLPTSDGTLWIKHAYRLPPGEERILEPLASRHPGLVPDVIATWFGGVAMKTLRGVELNEDHSLPTWCEAANMIGQLAAAEEAHADDWLALGVRDRRPTAFADALDALLASPVIATLDARLNGEFCASRDKFVERYAAAFNRAPTLVHQDSGCCNIHVGSYENSGGPVLFDWSDVVVGHPAYSCDRLLDQVSVERKAAVIEAFGEPLRMTATEYEAARRSNVLHEILRYHDELAWLHPEDELYQNLTASVQSQIGVLMRHEASLLDNA